MKSVIIVTPRYVESGRPGGLIAAALANALASSGSVVHVICRAGAAPRPVHEVRGPITVHRLDIRRKAPDAAFAPQACRRIRDLLVDRDDGVVHCIDAGMCAPLIDAFRRSGGFRATLVATVTHSDRTRPDDSLADIADARATYSVEADAHGQLPIPVDASLSRPPRVEGPVLIALDAFEAEQREIVLDAARRARLPEAGWSIAFPGADGRWSVLSGEGERECGDAVVAAVSVDGSGAALGLHAVANGRPVIISDASPIAAVTAWPSPIVDVTGVRSLADAFRGLVGLTRADADALAERSWSSVRDLCADARVVEAHERFWAAARPQLTANVRKAMWRTIESLSSGDEHVG